MQSQEIEINGTKYQAIGLTRGQVRQLEAEAGGEQTDLLVSLTVPDCTINDIPMRDYMGLVRWAIEHNGLDGSAIEAAKKN